MALPHLLPLDARVRNRRCRLPSSPLLLLCYALSRWCHVHHRWASSSHLLHHHARPSTTRIQQNQQRPKQPPRRAPRSRYHPNPSHDHLHVHLHRIYHCHRRLRRCMGTSDVPLSLGWPLPLRSIHLPLSSPPHPLTPRVCEMVLLWPHLPRVSQKTLRHCFWNRWNLNQFEQWSCVFCHLSHFL